MDSLKQRGRYSEGSPGRQGVGKVPFGVWILGWGVLGGGGGHPGGHGHGGIYGREPVRGQEWASVGGQSPDDESGAVLEEPEGKGKGVRNP